MSTKKMELTVHTVDDEADIIMIDGLTFDRQVFKFLSDDAEAGALFRLGSKLGPKGECVVVSRYPDAELAIDPAWPKCCGKYMQRLTRLNERHEYLCPECSKMVPKDSFGVSLRNT